jgi:hypothetical protein
MYLLKHFLQLNCETLPWFPVRRREAHAAGGGAKARQPWASIGSTNQRPDGGAGANQPRASIGSTNQRPDGGAEANQFWA